MNRLGIVTEGAAPTGVDNCGGSATWCRDFGYDRYGNRAVTGSVNGGLSLATPTATSAYTASNNRLTSAWANYDAAGNISAFVKSGYEWSAFYDAENKQRFYCDGTTAACGPSNAAAEYIYDGEGNRVQKLTTGVTETYVYDAFGRLAAEYSTAGPSGTPGSYFRTTDHLGSTRLVTDGSGNVYDRRDFFPFGEKILASSTYSNRQYVTGYNNTDPASAHLFTAKERDEESGLDYFLARYYSGALGRFTSPDAPFADQREENPKTWNLYSYVLNQPMLYVDPSGRECISTDDGGTADDGRGSFCDDNSLKKTHGVIVSANSSPFYTAFGDPIALGDIDLSGASDSISDASSELIDFIPSGKALKSGAVLASITLGVLRGSAGKFVKFSTQRALQRKWKHAAAFGVGGNFSHTGAASFQKAIVGHVNSPSTLQIRGTLRGIDGDVIHHYNPATGLNVTTTMDGEFVSGWKLSAEQAGHVVSTGKLGGGQ